MDADVFEDVGASLLRCGWAIVARGPGVLGEAWEELSVLVVAKIGRESARCVLDLLLDDERVVGLAALLRRGISIDAGERVGEDFGALRSELDRVVRLQGMVGSLRLRGVGSGVALAEGALWFLGDRRIPVDLQSGMLAGVRLDLGCVALRGGLCESGDLAEMVVEDARSFSAVLGWWLGEAGVLVSEELLPAEMRLDAAGVGRRHRRFVEASRRLRA